MRTCREDEQEKHAQRNFQNLFSFVSSFYVSFLFFPYGVDRLDLHGPAGRQDTGDEAAGDQHREREHAGRERDLGPQRDRHAGREERFGRRQQSDGQCQPENAGHERQYESLAHDLRDDRARLGSQCAANAYLLRSLADGHQHDVADADDARQQGAQTDDPCKDLQPAKQAVGHLDLFAHVPDHHRFRVVGRQRVAAVDDLFYALFDAEMGTPS